MSYQLVFTSAAELLTPGLSGYGVVARSMGMPRALVDQLCSLCQRHEEEEGELPGALFTYRIKQCRGQEFHVLSSIRHAGADYSGRLCHIAHHLALTEEEVQALRRNASRPTPAGLALALEQGHFWLRRWEGAPRLIEGEPKLTAAALPDASLQPTWKELTGHKSNARSLYTPPYDQNCIVLLPPTASTEQCLRLLHESDWLDSSRGWGRSFSTPGYTDETILQRSCCLAGHAPAPSTPRRASRPSLVISPELNLPPPAAEAPAKRAAALPAEPPRHVLPYSYAESTEEDIFETPTRHRPLKRNILYLSAIILLSTALYLGASDQADEIGGAARDTMRYFSSAENLSELRNLLAAPYSPDTSPARVEQLRARIATVDTGGDDALRRCMDTLCLAGSSPERFAAAPAELAASAQQLSLSQQQLLHLALLLATEGQDVADWQQSLSPEARKAWAPAIADGDWSREPRLAPFCRALLPADEAGEPTPPAQMEVSEEPPAIAAPLRPRHQEPATLPVLAGQPAPAKLLQALARAPLTLREGRFESWLWTPGQKTEPRRLELGPGERSLQLVEGGASGEYRIHPPAGDWELRLRVEDGVITELSEGGQPAALALPLADEAGQSLRLLLLPRMEFELEPEASSTPPAVPAQALQLGDDDLQLHPGALAPGRPRLMLSREKAHCFPWVPMEKLLTLRQANFYLPGLAGKNTIHPLPHADELPYNWDAVVEADGSCRVNLRRVYDFSHALHRDFLRMANDSCGNLESGGEPASTLAQAYALSLDMESRRTRQHAIEQYIKLFGDKVFGDFMRAQLREAPQWVPTPQAAGETAEQARSRVASAMSSAATRRAFRQLLRAAITRRLLESYQQECRRMARRPDVRLRLVLSRVERQADGSLAWYFKLEPTPH